MRSEQFWKLSQSAGGLALSAVLACALATAQTPPTALTAELADFIEMPRTTSSDGRSQAARINVLIEEPGSGRLFVAEHAGPLSIVDKTKRQAVSYINFNGTDGAPGLFPKFAPGGGFVSGLMGFAFDPDYRRNGVLYTIHLEDPALTVDGTPKAFQSWTRHSHTGRGSRALRSPTALSIAARGGLNFKAALFLATSRAADCFTHGWLI
jgi:hypothetical protein